MDCTIIENYDEKQITYIRIGDFVFSDRDGLASFGGSDSGAVGDQLRGYCHLAVGRCCA